MKTSPRVAPLPPIFNTFSCTPYWDIPSFTLICFISYSHALSLRHPVPCSRFLPPSSTLSLTCTPYLFTLSFTLLSFISYYTPLTFHTLSPTSHLLPTLVNSFTHTSAFVPLLSFPPSRTPTPSILHTRSRPLTSPQASLTPSFTHSAHAFLSLLSFSFTFVAFLTHTHALSLTRFFPYSRNLPHSLTSSFIHATPCF